MSPSAGWFQACTDSHWHLEQPPGPSYCVVQLTNHYHNLSNHLTVNSLSDFLFLYLPYFFLTWCLQWFWWKTMKIGFKSVLCLLLKHFLSVSQSVSQSKDNRAILLIVQSNKVIHLSIIQHRVAQQNESSYFLQATQTGHVQRHTYTSTSICPKNK